MALARVALVQAGLWIVSYLLYLLYTTVQIVYDTLPAVLPGRAAVPASFWTSPAFAASALIILAGTLIWTGEFDEGERWLPRTRQALLTDTGPDTTLLVHIVTGMLQAGRGRHREALQEFSAADHLRSQLADSHALASQVTGCLLATQARLGMTGEARTFIAELDDERASSGEIRNARAVTCLAEGDPAAALAALEGVLDGTAPVLGYVTVMEAHLLAGLAHRELGDQRAAHQAAERARWPWRSPTGWSCCSR
jgi:LuxR family transcriptional regulator, maltose regulon positive regulatory protein